jgi:hypothetical protein
MTKDAIEATIREAFANVTVPPADELLQPTYASNDDAYELRMALAGKQWSEVPIHAVFRHREMIIGLSGVGYQAYVPAVLLGALTEDPQYGGDLRQYLLFGLVPASESDVHVTTTRERLSRLDASQRAAIADVVRYVAETYHSKEAAEILTRWSA